MTDDNELDQELEDDDPPLFTKLVGYENGIPVYEVEDDERKQDMCSTVM